MSIRWTTTTTQRPCEACGSKKRCGYTEDGGIHCYKGPFEGSRAHKDQHGEATWIRLPSEPTKKQFGPEHRQAERGTPTQLHQAYSFILAELGLTSSHRDALLARGFTAAEILTLGFKSLGRGDRRQVAAKAAELYPFWRSVPGLCLDSAGRPNVSGGEGLLIPCKDTSGRIIALRLRPDNPPEGCKYLWLSSLKKGGPGPGAPLSMWGDPSCGKFGLVEGEFKAALMALRLGMCVISAPGSNGLGSDAVLETLRGLKASELHFAPDADASVNPDVNRDTHRAICKLNAAGFSVSLGVWRRG